MILITGGAGFIGSNLLARIAERAPWDVLVCDTFGTEDKWKNVAKHPCFNFITPEELPSYLQNKKGLPPLQAVFHMGAISSTTARDLKTLLESNVELSKTLWNFSTEENIPFFYASSAGTYGDGSLGFDDRFDEEYLRALRPLSPYGWSKNLFDLWVWHQVNVKHRHPPQWAGLKFFNVYGPNEYHKGGQQSVVAHLYPQIQEHGVAKLFKSYQPDYQEGHQLRDFIWVEDCVNVMLWLWDTPQVSGLFNVGTGTARSFFDLATAVFSALGRRPSITYIDMPDGLNATYQYYTQAPMDKLRQAGYTRPFTSLEEGVRHYVQNYLSQPDPYR